MGKLQRPLDPEAVEAADENLYAAHGSDPRPNALYDADGNQIPLDGSDPRTKSRMGSPIQQGSQ